MSHHQSAKAMALMEMEITSDVAISLAHSKYDTNAIPLGPMPRYIMHIGVVPHLAASETHQRS
jgi:hypothetical protein